ALPPIPAWRPPFRLLCSLKKCSKGSPHDRAHWPTTCEAQRLSSVRYQSSPLSSPSIPILTESKRKKLLANAPFLRFETSLMMPLGSAKPLECSLPKYMAAALRRSFIGPAMGQYLVQTTATRRGCVMYWDCFLIKVTKLRAP